MCHITSSPINSRRMMKVTCIKSVSFGATGEQYSAGESYDVTAAVMKDYSEYFTKQAGTVENKMASTVEDKSAGAAK